MGYQRELRTDPVHGMHEASYALNRTALNFPEPSVSPSFRSGDSLGEPGSGVLYWILAGWSTIAVHA